MDIKKNLFCFFIFMLFLSCSNNIEPNSGEKGGTLNITATRSGGGVDSSHKIYVYTFDHFPAGPTDSHRSASGETSVSGDTITLIYNENQSKIFIVGFYDLNGNGVYDTDGSETAVLYGSDPVPTNNYISIQNEEIKSISLNIL